MLHKDNRLLNAMRLIAALMVVAGHVRTSFFRDYATEPHNAVTALAYALTSLGNPAVMVFFALSGYWVGGSAFKSILRDDFAFGPYLLRRLVRLWIVLIPALFLTLAVDMAGMHGLPRADIYARPELYTAIPQHISHSAATMLGNMAFLQDLRITEYGYDMPLWSLSYEFWYYIAFPCLILLVVPGRTVRVRLAALAGLVLALGVGGKPLLMLAPSWLLGAVAGTFPAALDGWRARWGERVWAMVQVCGALALIGVMCVARSGKAGALGGIVLGVTCALVILSMARDAGGQSRLLDGLSRLSHCTYSLYTTHMALVVIMAAAIVPAFNERWVLMSPRGVLLPVMMAVLFGVGWTFAQVTERRTDDLRRWLTASWQRGRTASPPE